MIGGAEFPGVGKEDGDDLARFDASRDEAVCEAFDCISVFGVAEAAFARSVDDGGLFRMAAAGLEDQLVEKEVRGIGVELGAQRCHAVAGRATGAFSLPRAARRIPAW